MNKNEQKTRDQIDKKYKWNIEAMYPDEASVFKDIEQGINNSQELLKMAGHLLDTSDSLFNALGLYSNSMRLIEKAYIYSHMKRDEDNSNSKYIEMFGKAVSALTEFSSNTSFMIPELLESEYDLVLGYIESEPKLHEFKFLLEQIYLEKEHTLSKEQEYIMASLGEVLNSSDEIFSVLNDVDMNFGIVKDEFGSEIPLTHASYSQFLESDSRDVRKDAYNKMYAKYEDLNNTIAAIYSNNVKVKVTSSKLRKYNSAIDSSLSPANIPLDVYMNLIKAVNNHLPSLHKYVELKKSVLKIEDFRMYDMYKPLVKPENKKYTFEEAVDICCEALKPLGEEYIKTLINGLLNERWVDIYENKGKTSGAFSFGSYDSYPYILMNFTGELRDVFTLIHESGHSMHSYYTRKTQPYIYGDHSIFTAEVASTVNETLLINYLLDNCKSNQMRAYLLNFYIEEFKSTLFRQTMFAEFELEAHKQVESGTPLSAEYLNEMYNNLNIKYYGSSVSADDMIKYEWSRIPHFYNAFYVYQYATGYSAANAIANKILNEGVEARDNYLKFLSTGSSNYPIELLKIAGVDMSKTEPVESALRTFDKLVEELSSILRG